YIACRVAYDGSSFHGSQLQQNASSVQGELENAIEKVCCHPTRIVLAGRTDAGVHAFGQCFRFVTESALPVERVSLALNANLDKSVRVREAKEVVETFHPRFSALSRTYRYWIENAVTGNVLLAHTAANCREPLDLVAMQQAAERLVGRHDFVSFQSAGSPAPNTVRCVKRLQVRRLHDVLGSSLIEIEIEADAFLYRMVRNIVGMLMAVGNGRLVPSDVTALMQSKDRNLCPSPAPPQGLCLVDVKYNWEKFQKYF
ncbi:MAG: tRNA pseudouridine(38-40) synthase TruA, partial [Abditibacteriaceae bacterium]